MLGRPLPPRCLRSGPEGAARNVTSRLARAGAVDGFDEGLDDGRDEGREDGLPDGAERRDSGRRTDVCASGSARDCDERDCDERD